MFYVLLGVVLVYYYCSLLGKMENAHRYSIIFIHCSLAFISILILDVGDSILFEYAVR